MVSLISLSGCSRFALLAHLSVLSSLSCILPVCGSFICRFSLPEGYWYSQLPSYLVCDFGQGVGGVDYDRGEYSMGYKLSKSRE